MCFKQKVVISTLSGNSLKLADQLTYFGSNISSTESDIMLNEGVEYHRQVINYIEN